MTPSRSFRVLSSLIAASVFLPTVAMAATPVPIPAPAPAVEAPEETRTPEEESLLRDARVKINYQFGSPRRGDFAMGPGRITVEMAPGEQQTIEVLVTSFTDGLRSYAFESEDYSVSDDGNGSTTLFGASAGPYPARTWLKPAVPGFHLGFAERAYVPVTISVPKDAEPGDHYAALLLRRALLPGETTSRGFDVISRVGTLFLITVKGPVVRDTQLLSLSSRQGLYWFFPAFLQLSAKNDGTVFSQPDGVIEIRNILGFVVDELPVKDWYLLRNSRKTQTLMWNPRFALGRYTATAKLTAYGQDLPRMTTAFWVFPALPLLLALFLIFLVSFLVQFFFSRFEITRKGEERHTK